MDAGRKIFVDLWCVLCIPPSHTFPCVVTLPKWKYPGAQILLAMDDGKAVKCTLLNFYKSMSNVNIHNYILLWVTLYFTGTDLLKILFGDRFYHEVKSAGLLDPTVIRPQMPLQPSEPSPPSQAFTQPQSTVFELVWHCMFRDLHVPCISVTDTRSGASPSTVTPTATQQSISLQQGTKLLHTYNVLTSHVFRPTVGLGVKLTYLG